MKFTMDDVVKTLDSPAMNNMEREPESSSPAKKSRKKLHIIIAISAVVGIALALTAILVGIYFFTDAEKNLIKEVFKTDPHTTQETTSDLENNVIQYHVVSSGQEADMVSDYNSYIEVIKLTRTTGTRCFAKPLNETSGMDLTSLIILQTPENSTTELVLYFSPYLQPIKDTSFLSKKAQTMCAGIPIFWLHPECGTPTNRNDVSRIQKRSISCDSDGCTITVKVFGHTVTIHIS